MDTLDEKFDAMLAIVDRLPQLLEAYFILFIQQRNIRSGANTMDAQSGLTLIGDPGSGILGLHPGGTQFTDENGTFTDNTANGGQPSAGH